jgi:hypothetical protein
MDSIGKQFVARHARMNVGHGLEATYHLATPIATYDLNIKPSAVSPDRNSVEGHAIDVYRPALGGPARCQHATRPTMPASPCRPVISHRVN